MLQPWIHSICSVFTVATFIWVFVSSVSSSVTEKLLFSVKMTELKNIELLCLEKTLCFVSLSISTVLRCLISFAAFG